MKVTYLQTPPSRAGIQVHLPLLLDGEEAVAKLTYYDGCNYYRRDGNDLHYEEHRSERETKAGIDKNWFNEERINNPTMYYKVEII